MPILRLCAPVVALLLCLACLAPPALAQTLTEGWRFMAGDVPGAQQPGHDDGAWQKVAVPHDFSIQDKPGGRPPFNRAAEGGQDSGYLPGGTGWYRRELALSRQDAAKVVRLHFEAVYMDSEVWLNGERVAAQRYGYTAFSVDLTGKVRAGRNLIAVKVRHRDPSSRWYAGSGIIRPVTLELLERVHVAPDSVFVSTARATPLRATLKAQAAVVNRHASARRVELVTRVLTLDDARVVAEARGVQQLAANGRAAFDQALEVEHPRLWSPDAPNLYVLVQETRVDGVLTDTRRTRFGIRTIAVDARHGLRINGQPIKLRGGNIHHDNYMLGAAGFPDADARKVALLKAAGYNAIRSAHNPASQATLDAADELGMLVINEAFDMWRKHKRTADYARFFEDSWEKDIDSMVLAGRNHPSVLFWSIGNEIPEQGTPEGARTARALVERIRRLDPGRPVTQGVSIDAPQNVMQFAELDVAGYNYRAHLFEQDHQQFPERVMYTSESFPKQAFAYWRPVETMPWVIGDFVWTAFDYLGEAGIGWMGYSRDWQKLGPYPWHLAYCGEIDATGRKRPAAYYRQVLWKTGIDPIAMFVAQPPGTEDLPDRHYFPVDASHYDWSLDDVHPSWSWPGQEGKPLEVVVYSEFPEVELFVNGESLGRRKAGLENEYKARYTVRYTPGRLVAVGYRNGQPAGRWELRTAGQPAAIRVSSDRMQLRADGQALAYISAELVDEHGVPVYARGDERKLQVRVAGAGVLAGAGNGNPMDASSLQSGERTTFHGRVVAVVRAGLEAGPIDIEVVGGGLPAQRIRLDAVAR